MEGKPAPAAVNLSPVARDYPSRALGDLFQTAALRLSQLARVRPSAEVCEGCVIGPPDQLPGRATKFMTGPSPSELVCGATDGFIGDASSTRWIALLD